MEQLAKDCGVSIGDESMDVEKMVKIGTYLGKSLDYLICGDESKKNTIDLSGLPVGVANIMKYLMKGIQSKEISGKDICEFADGITKGEK